MTPWLLLFVMPKLLLLQLTTKEVKQVQEDKTKLTEHFIVALPQLLAKVCVTSIDLDSFKCKIVKMFPMKI